MLKSDIIKIYKNDIINSDYIESELKKLGLEPVRWAIVDVEEDCLIISVSYVK